MIIFDLCSQHTVEKSIMAKRRNVRDSFGKRVRDGREEKGLTQSDMIRLLNERYGIQMSEAAFSKIEIGETKRLHIDLQMAIAGILNNDIRYLLTGEEVGSTALAWSEEAEIIAGLVDSLLPRSRRLVEIVARNLLAIDNEQRENEKELIELLMENINLLPNGAGKIAKDYIDRSAHRSG